MLKFVDIFRFCCGYVTFEATEGFTDKFLNSCKAEGILLFGVSSKKGVLVANAFINDYRRMPNARRNSDMKVRIKEKHGLPFIIYNRRNRVGLPIGMVIFFTLLFILSGRVWNIEVVGNSQVSVNEIVETYAEQGITIGTRVSSVDLDTIKENVVNDIPELIWTSFNASGGLGVINVREGEPTPDLKNDNPPCNVVAKYGGQITKYEVYEGTAEQVVNAAVAQGDLLISGVITLADGASLLKAADGRVEAKTNRIIESTIDETFELYEVLNVNSGKQVSFFGILTPLFPWKPECTKIYSVGTESYAVLGGVILPIGLVSSDRIAVVPLDCWDGETRNENRLTAIGLDKYLRTHISEMSEAEILKNIISVSSNGTSLKFEGEYECIENICEYSEIVYTE